jgi:Alkylated DNA repair protein
MLFADASKNLLPYDGVVNYYGKVFEPAMADAFFQKLLTEAVWKNDQAVVFGKLIETKRKVAWYGDVEFEYKYSGITKRALRWIPVLQELRYLVESLSGETYNSCLLNLYHSGDEGMAWHSDGEPDLKKNGAIASVTFGAERKFSFKHKQSKQRVDILLEHGSLLVMKDVTQTYWLHRLPPTRSVTRPRVNLTFRTIVNGYTATASVGRGAC